MSNPAISSAGAESEIPLRRSAATSIESIAPWVTAAIVALHFILLALSLGDYRVSIDSGFHVSLAEWYAHHGAAWWDHVNFGPRGRPNLQGPGLHVAIAALGTVLGGRPGDFILANAILALAQWCAAIATLWFFARRASGAVAAMFAVALFAGAGFTSASFYLGVPSGWVFIAIPWAIYFFQRDRLMIATAIATASCYTHLGGYFTAPVGIVIAAALERRWRALLQVGMATAVLTAPFTIHFLVNLEWFRGQHAIESLRYDAMLELVAIAGLLWLFTHSPGDTFLIAWALAPIAWLFQDPYRFILQEGLAGAAVGGIFLAEIARRLDPGRGQLSAALAIVAIATLFPLGPPSLAGEISWDAGYRWPRMLNWERARQIAATIERNHLEGRLLATYQNSLGSAVAVFAPVTVEKGHWVEVQPRDDPADDLSAGAKVYVLPLSPGDPFLRDEAAAGLVKIYGGTSDCAVVTLTRAGDPRQVEPIFDREIADNAQWLADHAINNQLLDVKLLEFPRLTSAAELNLRHAQVERQRAHAGRMEAATLLYAYAMERSRPEIAKALRAAALGFGNLASFLSDGDAVGDESAAEHARFRRDIGALAAVMRAHPVDPTSSLAVRRAFVRLFEDYFRTDIPEADHLSGRIISK
jgi:hypothetical protein